MKRLFRLSGLIVLLSLFFTIPGMAAPRAEVPPNATSPIGTNSDFMRYWASEWEFVDAFKTSQPWLTQCDPALQPQQPDCTWSTNNWDTSESAQLDLDQNGWVRSLPAPGDAPTYWIASTTLFGGFTNGHYPSGQYIVLYDGEGTLVYGNDAVRDSAASTAGRDVLNVTATRNGILLKITATDPSHNGNYIRNIRVIMPGYESTYQSQIFHPTFLNLIRKYRAYRFLNWMETDGSTQTGAWADRPKLTEARWTTGRGVPLETMIALSNRATIDPWFNIPHKASDDYVTQFATMTRDTLDPSLKVYVEYTNEVWNPAFPFSLAGTYARDHGVALWPSSPASDYTKQINWFGLRTAQICDIWKNVWGAQKDRVVCVMGAQFYNSWTSSQALDCPLWTEGAPCSGHGIDAVAVGAYFGGYIGNTSFNTQVKSWTSDPDGGLNKLFTEIQTGGMITGGPAGGALQSAYDMISQHTAITSARGLELVAYEGGHHLFSVAGDADVRTLFDNASHDPRMGPIYSQYLAGWKSHGGHLFVNFKNVAAPGSYGSMGVLDYTDQTSSYRYDALMGFIDSNPCWWTGCSVVTSPTFTDVPYAYWANGYIERLYDAGITGGCSTSPLNYCPDSTVTRAQMAVFLLKGMHGSSFTPPAINGSTGFTDVPTDHWAAAWIKQLAAEGITSGCGAGIYCPEATVTRAQMAVFLLKAKHTSAYAPPNAAGVFTDVPLGYWADKWIEQLAAEGITTGCGTGVYCPDSAVTRAQMAIFLVKAFSLP